LKQWKPGKYPLPTRKTWTNATLRRHEQGAVLPPTGKRVSAQSGVELVVKKLTPNHHTIARNTLLIEYRLSNQIDKKTMGIMRRKAKSIPGKNQFMRCYKKGCHTCREFAIANGLGIAMLVAIPAIGTGSHAPQSCYNVKNFLYDPENDTYFCLVGEVLRSNQILLKVYNSILSRRKPGSVRPVQ
jgi:hypothetical protein